VAAVSSEPDANIETLLQASPVDTAPISFGREQSKYADINKIICFQN